MKLACAGVLIGVVGLAGLIAGCGDDHRHRVIVERDRGPGTVVVHEQTEGPRVVVEDRPAEVVVVREAPPPMRVEVRPAPPSREHIWIGGYYNYHNDRHEYIWVSGHYDKPPRKGAHWVEDKWEKDKDGYHHQSGHWN